VQAPQGGQDDAAPGKIGAKPGQLGTVRISVGACVQQSLGGFGFLAGSDAGCKHPHGVGPAGGE